jgi:hypothetical protein
MALPASVPEITVCFQEAEIGALFAELLRQRGATVIICQDLALLPPNAKVITEPSFLASLDKTQHPYCLLVTNRAGDAPQGVTTLVRPLTEEKIERALVKLLT